MYRLSYACFPLVCLGVTACLGAPEGGDDDGQPATAVSVDEAPPRGRGHVKAPVPEAPDAHLEAVSAAAATNRISYHGGAVMTSGVNVYLIWYGAWSGNSATTILTDLVSNLGGSPWFNINTTYGKGTTPVQNVVNYAGSTTDAYSKGTVLTDAAVQAVVSGAISSGALPGDESGVYFVLTSSDVSEKSGFCSSYCGWHDHATISGTDIKYAFVGNPDACPAECEWETASPNGNAGADGMASVLAHELAETVTDPDLDAWYDATGYENADKCAWTFGTTYVSPSGATANVHLGSRDYLIQQNWLNSGNGRCAVGYGSARPSASGVTISGTPYVTSTLTGVYTFSDPSGLAESGSTFQWYRAGSAIPGATGTTYSPTGADTNGSLTFCVTPADVNGAGTRVCSSAVTVPAVMWFTGASQTGAGTSVPGTAGACVAMSSVGAVGSFNSLRLDGHAGGTTTILMFTSGNCSGAVWTRTAGADTAHDINLATVGIGSAIRSYSISW